MIFSHWTLVWADLISEYGFDVGDRTMMRNRPWKSLRTMIVGLVSSDSRLSRKLSEK